jgi:hypothetical protein
MKIYGVGVFTAPGSSRVIHDFIDGPFDTVNPVLIQEAKRRGYSFSPPESEIETPKDTPKRRGRPSKGN